RRCPAPSRRRRSAAGCCVRRTGPGRPPSCRGGPRGRSRTPSCPVRRRRRRSSRSEEHTSELQSRENLVCRLLLEKKKKKRTELSVKTAVSVRCKSNSTSHDVY